MATVVKVTIPQYFSCYRGPMTHLCAKFHQDRSNNEEKIMSQTTALYIYDDSEFLSLQDVSNPIMQCNAIFWRDISVFMLLSHEL